MAGRAVCRIVINREVRSTSNHILAESLRVTIIALQDLDLEGDWDPDAHDRQMAGIYAQDDDGGFHDEEKPTWDDDIDIDDIVPPMASSSKKKRDKKDRKKGKADVDEDGDYEMGEGGEVYGEDEEWDEEWDGTEETRKKKLQEYMDSLLELEFNDVVSVNSLQRHPHRISHSSPSIGGRNPHEIQIHHFRASDIRADTHGDSHGGR